MILTFRHKGLEVYFKTGRMAGIQAIHAKRLRELLTALNVASGQPSVVAPARPVWRPRGVLCCNSAGQLATGF